MKVLIVIPSRWKSSRFIGKPLALINNIPMIERVYEKALHSKEADKVYVATDNEKILNFCKTKKIKVIMTSEKCKTGSDRVYEVSKKINSDIYVNLQGDEPLVNPTGIDAIIKLLKKNLKKNILVSTGFVEIPKNIRKKPKGVYLVCNKFNEIIFLSRYPITSNFKNKIYKKKHIGIYAFTKKSLHIFNKLKPGELELSESIEILRLIENGYKIIAEKIKTPLINVNYPKDIKKVENFLNNK